MHKRDIDIANKLVETKKKNMDIQKNLEHVGEKNTSEQIYKVAESPKFTWFRKRNNFSKTNKL